MFEVPAASSYTDVPVDELVAIGAMALGIGAVCVVISALVTRKHLLPIVRWMSGSRDEATAIEAWHSGVFGLVRVLSIGVALFCVGYAPLAFYAVRRVGLNDYDFFYVYGFFVLGICFSATLDYFAFHWLQRPVVRDVAAWLPADFRSDSAALSLRARMLIVMTIVSSIVGVLTMSVANTIAVGPARFVVGMGVVLLVVAVIGIPPVALLADDVARPFREVMAAASRTQRGDLGTRVPVLAADEGGAMASEFNAMLRGLREREVLREAVGSYVNPAVAERLVAEGQLLGGQQVDGTAMFVDIRGFTQWCEAHDADDAVALLNEFFGVLVPIIDSHGGHANKFLGDGLLAGFGAPVEYEDHARRAVSAAHDIIDAVERQFRGALKVGIGINSGPFIVGTVGGGGHLEFAMIGDTVNVAARLEQLTKETGDQVLASAATVATLVNSEVAERGSVVVRGRSEPVSVYALTPRQQP